MDDALAYYINLNNTGARKIEMSCNSQPIALTTQIGELKSKLGKLSSTKAPSKLDESKPSSTNGSKQYIFELWHLKKIDNKAEHNMVEPDEKVWYWCDKHRYNNKGVVTNGMYVTHKPDGHDDWAIKRKKKGPFTNATTSTSTTFKSELPASVVNDSSATKLSLSKSLQAALVTTAGISEDQFKKILDEACNALGN
jgi:hypothetical protein